MTQHYDAVVIGTGQGGAPLAASLGASGRKTAVIERALFGGTCVNVGCTPTKAYVASARAAHVARHAAELGVQITGKIAVDLSYIKARKDKIVEQSRSGVEKWLREAEHVSVFNGHGRFTSPNTLSISNAAGAVTQQISADAIFINTGTRASVPALPGLERVRYYTNASLLELTTLPEHLIIIGSSYIALEFAQIFRRFGSRVSVLVRGERVLSREDADIAQALQDVLAGEGIEFHFGTQPGAVAPSADGVQVQCGDRSVSGSHLFIATGRQPNTDDLGLDAAGVSVDARGIIQVDGDLRSNVPGIWAIGDVNGRGAFTHTSFDDYQIVAAQLGLIDAARRSVDDRIMAYAVFTDPPLARVGLSEAELRKAGTPALIATQPMSRVGRARERGETAGFMKVLVHAHSKQILGAALLGIEGDEAIHTFIDTMTAGAPYTTLQYALHVHPTVSELVPTLLGNLQPLPPSPR